MTVTVTDVKIPFDSMVVLIIKWTFASICAGAVLSFPLVVAWAIMLAGN